MADHSPGPWIPCTADGGKCPCGLIWSEPDDIPVAQVFHRHPEPFDQVDRYPPALVAANRRLIASAPDLLRQRDELADLVRRYLRSVHHDDLDAEAEKLLARIEAERAKETSRG